jgi:2-keto-4-pentenoate hydratase/2-oxohepta-3-ene-1,7-dioic acid hydratase in catechol pathway
MKLFRFGEAGAERPGVLVEGRRLDVSAFCRDYDEAFLAGGGLAGLRTWIDQQAGLCPVVPDSVRLGSCVARPSKIICVGMNYAKHARESGSEPPKEPVLFFKSTTALGGPNDDLVIPRGSVKTDYEVELAMVIGTRASYVTLADALRHVAGYCVHNDYSEREWQLERGGQWVKGKSADTYAPLGPWLVTADEVSDPQALRLWLTVNGQPRQDSKTSDMVFGCAHLVSYISQFMTLLPGDVISTGTPAGVGLGMKPPTYLVPGDIMELGVEGLGTQRQVARASA